MPLLILALLALAVPFLLSRLTVVRPPIVVGEIIVGIIIGRSGLQLVDPNNFVVEFSAEFGLAFLFFLAGMEIDFSSLGLKPNLRARKAPTGRLGPVSLSLIIFALTLIAGAIVSLGLAQLGGVANIGFMTLILAPSSLGLIVAVLKEKELTSTRFGQIILTAALVADFGTVLLLTIFVAFLEFGFSVQAFLVGLIFVAFAIVYLITRYLSDKIVVRRVMETLNTATAQIKIRFALVLLLFFSTLSQVLDAKVVLGSFLAGALISLLAREDDREALHQLEAMGFGFFIPVFFIRVGLNFDLPALLASREALLLVPVIVIGALLVKILPALVLRFQFGWQDTFAAGFLLSARLSLVIAEAAIGVELEILNDPLNADIVLVALTLATITPLLFERLAPEAPAPERAPPVLVAGVNDLGLEVGTQLRGHLADVIFLDPDADGVALARARGFQAIQTPLDNPTQEAQVVLDQANTLISSYTDAEINYPLCALARHSHGVKHVVTQVTEPVELIRFEALGVKTMNSAMDRAAHLVLLARNPDMYDLLTRTDDDKEVVEVVVREEHFVGRLLRECRLPGDVLILAVRRDGELLVPQANTRLDRDDHLTLVGSREHVRVAFEQFTGLQLPVWRSDQV